MFTPGSTGRHRDCLTSLLRAIAAVFIIVPLAMGQSSAGQSSPGFKWNSGWQAGPLWNIDFLSLAKTTHRPGSALVSGRYQNARGFAFRNSRPAWTFHDAVGPHNLIATRAWTYQQAVTPGHSSAAPALTVIPLTITTDTWTNGTSNTLWGTAGNWSAGLPGSSNNVVIAAGGANGTVNENVSATINNLTVNAGNSLIIENAQSLTINGTTISNGGNISIGSEGNITSLILTGNDTVTLSGGGTLTIGGNSTNEVYSAGGSGRLINLETIQGGGQLGMGVTAITNSGTIDGNNSTMILSPNSSGVTNTGTLESSTSGRLLLEGTYTNTGGLIQALANSTVQLSGATINGGTLTTTGAGAVLESSANDTLNGVTISSGSTFTVINDADTTLIGTITNKGTISLDSEGNNTSLILAGNDTITLTGGGTLNMTGAPDNLVYSAGGSGRLINDETIQGDGNLGLAETAITNAGTIDADVGNTLTVSPSSSGITNTGTLEATNGGRLDLKGLCTCTGGSIKALTGSTVVLDGATITGGTLSTAGTGIIEANSNPSTLSGVTLSSGSNYLNPDGTITILKGTVTNNGTMQLTSEGSDTQLEINGAVTLAGTGVVTMGNNTNNRIVGYFSGTNSFTNKATIQGSGQIGAGTIGIVNDGKIIANQSTALSIQASSGGKFTNNGTLQVSSGSIMHVSGGPFTNFASGTLTGGTYSISGKLEIDELGTAGGEIVTNKANITLNGSSSSFVDADGNNALSKLATNASGASFSLTGGRNFTTVGNFTNSGTLVVGSGSKFDVNGNLTNFSSTTNTLTGGIYNLSGTLQFNGANIVTNAANITLNGSSSAIISQTSANGLANFATNASTGTFVMTGSRTLTTVGNLANAGTMTVGSGSTLNVHGNLTSSAGTVTDSGTITVPSANMVSLTGGSLYGNGTITGAVKSSSAATITPGTSATATGILKETGAYTQNSGKLDITISGLTAGTQFDQLNPTTASLSGTLNVARTSTFTPAIASTFKIMNFTSKTGTFATVNGLAINSSEHFTITYQTGDVLLSVVSGALPAVRGRHSGLSTQPIIVFAPPSGPSPWGAASTPRMFAMNAVGHQDAMTQIPTIGQAGSLSAGAMPLSFSSVGPSAVARIPAAAPSPSALGSTARAASTARMVPMVFHVDALSFVEKGPRKALRDLWKHPGSGNGDNSSYISFGLMQ